MASMSKADCDIRIGTTGRYAGSYPKPQLQDWAKWLKDQSKKVRAIYVYFNNDAQAHAIKNAQTLRMLVGTHY